MKASEISYTVAFPQGGYITLDVDAEMTTLDEQDRAFVADLIQQVHGRMMASLGVGNQERA